MKLLFLQQEGSAPVSEKLKQTLSAIAVADNVSAEETALTFNFRDTSYSAETGGYHPVEIRIEQRSGQWIFCYITDFAFVGSAYPELAKEFDFDIENGVAFVQYFGESPINSPEVIEFYQMWEQNFLDYIEMDCFDEIHISSIFNVALIIKRSVRSDR